MGKALTTKIVRVPGITVPEQIPPQQRAVVAHQTPRVAFRAEQQPVPLELVVAKAVTQNGHWGFSCCLNVCLYRSQQRPRDPGAVRARPHAAADFFVQQCRTANNRSFGKGSAVAAAAEAKVVIAKDAGKLMDCRGEGSQITECYYWARRQRHGHAWPSHMLKAES